MSTPKRAAGRAKSPPAEHVPDLVVRGLTAADVAALEADPRSGTVLPGISPPEATRPSTIYKGQRPERARPADADDLVPEHAHQSS
jgi:hypothetical protein